MKFYLRHNTHTLYLASVMNCAEIYLFLYEKICLQQLQVISCGLLLKYCFFFSGSVKSYIYITTNSMVCRASSKGSGFIINYLEF